MKSAIVIPARYGSSRFPGKPLALIKGKSMLERMWRIAQAAGADDVVIATDDERIENAAREFGAKIVRTSQECKNGTERVYEALKQLKLKPDVVLNLQGDAVLTPPWVLQALIGVMQDASVQLATPAVKITMEQYRQLQEQKRSGVVGGTLVVFNSNFDAMYFSKSMIPFVRSTVNNDAPLYRHIGLYAYRYKTLERYLSLSPGGLELTEGLEQLRALENGIPVRVVVVDYKGRTHGSVDSPADVTFVEKIIDQEGELLPQLTTR